MGTCGGWIEIAPPGAASCPVAYPKGLMPDGVAGKSSIIFDCDDVEATVAGRRERGVSVLQQPKVMPPARSRLSAAKDMNTGCAAA